MQNCGLTREKIGSSLTIKQTRGGCLLLELPKGSSSTNAAKAIASAMHSKLGDSVGKVVQLGVQVEVEVLDIDAAATASEVLEALRNAISGQDYPAAAYVTDGGRDRGRHPHRVLRTDGASAQIAKLPSEHHGAQSSATMVGAPATGSPGYRSVG
ncbi:hypothetical protein QTP88_007814 [Uroleucon formosanum]